MDVEAPLREGAARDPERVAVLLRAFQVQQPLQKAVLGDYGDFFTIGAVEKGVFLVEKAKPF